MRDLVSPFTLTYVKAGRQAARPSSRAGGGPPRVRRDPGAADRETHALVAEVRGGLIPTAVYETRGLHGRVSLPTVNGSTLRR